MHVDGVYTLDQFEELVKEYYHQIYVPMQKRERGIRLSLTSFLEAYLRRFWDDAPTVE